jgi:hypothetical protein
VAVKVVFWGSRVKDGQTRVANFNKPLRDDLLAIRRRKENLLDRPCFSGVTKESVAEGTDHARSLQQHAASYPHALALTADASAHRHRMTTPMDASTPDSEPSHASNLSMTR